MNELNGRGKRTSVISTKVEPQLEYLTRLAANVRRKKLSSLIEAALIDTLKQTPMSTRWNRSYRDDDGFPEEWNEAQRDAGSIWGKRDQLWSTDPAERFLRLAMIFENHLPEREETVWRVIHEMTVIESVVEVNGDTHKRKEWPASRLEQYVRRHWTLIESIIDGKAELLALPDESQKQ